MFLHTYLFLFFSYWKSANIKGRGATADKASKATRPYLDFEFQ